MAQVQTLEALLDFSGGENHATPPEDLRPNEAQLLQNVRLIGRSGGVYKRPGHVRYNATPLLGSTQGVRGLYRYYFGDSGRKLIVGYGSSLYEGDDATGDLTEISGGGAYTPNLFWDFETWRDCLFAVNGSNIDIQRWNGKDAIEGISGSPNGCVAVLDFMERLWAARESELFFTEDGDETAWDLNNWFFYIGEDDGSQIRALAKPFGDYMMIFKDMSVFRLMGESPENFVIRPMFENLGIVAPRSLATTDNVAIWVSHRGVHYFDGATLHDIGDPIQPLIEPALRHPQGRRQFAGGLNGFLYWLSYPSATALEGDGKNDRTSIFDIRRGAWVSDTRGFQCFHSLDGPGDSKQMVAGDVTQGLVSKLDEGTDDDGDPIEWRVKTRVVTYGRPDWIKQLQRMTREADLPEGAAITLKWRVDDLTGSTTKRTHTVPATTKGQRLEFELSASDTLDWSGKVIRGVIAEAVPDRSILWGARE